MQQYFYTMILRTKEAEIRWGEDTPEEIKIYRNKENEVIAEHGRQEYRLSEHCQYVSGKRQGYYPYTLERTTTIDTGGETSINKHCILTVRNSTNDVTVETKYDKKTIKGEGEDIYDVSDDFKIKIGEFTISLEDLGFTPEHKSSIEKRKKRN